MPRLFDIDAQALTNRDAGGIQHVEAIETFPADKWDAIIAIDLSSAFLGMRGVIPGMKARRWGRIINIASAHGLVASQSAWAGHQAYVNGSSYSVDGTNWPGLRGLHHCTEGRCP